MSTPITASLATQRDAFVLAMSEHLAAADEATSEERAAAKLLLDRLLGYLETGNAQPAAEQPHRDHIVSFGDGIAPVLSDVLGPDLPAATIASCVDSYWRMIRA